MHADNFTNSAALDFEATVETSHQPLGYQFPAVGTFGSSQAALFPPEADNNCNTCDILSNVVLNKREQRVLLPAIRQHPSSGSKNVDKCEYTRAQTITGDRETGGTKSLF